MRQIETARLVLRPFRWHDFEPFHRLAYADPEVAPWWTGCTKTLDEVRDSFARKVQQVPGAPGWLALTLKESGALIGGMGLQRWLPDEDTHWFIPEDPEDAPDRQPIGLERGLVGGERVVALQRQRVGRGLGPDQPRDRRPGADPSLGGHVRPHQAGR